MEQNANRIGEYSRGTAWLRYLAITLPLLFGLWCQFAVAAEDAVQPAGFDHLSTGFALRGAHERIPCENCHIHGIFKGTPTRCSGCHGRITEMEASKKPASHIPTVQECDLCHNDALPNVSWQLAKMDHLGIVNNCAQCHDNRKAPGKTPNHIPTRAPCENCHRSFATFSDAVGFDHSELATNPQRCSGCHNGSFAEGPVSPHINMRAHDCGDQQFGCHRAPATTTGDWFVQWRTAQHNGYGVALGDHSCGGCHNRSFADIQRPEPPPNRPGPHSNLPRATLDRCDDCHISLDSFGIVQTRNSAPWEYRLKAVADAVAGLLGNLIAKAEAAEPEPPCNITSPIAPGVNVCRVHQTAANASKPCSDCHADRFGLTSKNDAPPPGHVPTKASCENCHSAVPSYTDTVLPTFADKVAMNHAGVTKGCGACHGNGKDLFPNVAAHIVNTTDAPAPHIIYPAKFDCSACHTSASIPNGFDPGGFKHVTMNHKGIKGACQSCHDGIKAQGKNQPTAAFPNGFPHLDTQAGTDCALCHKATIVKSGLYASWAGGTWDHKADGINGGTQCNTCHGVAGKASGTEQFKDASGKLLHIDVIKRNTAPATAVSCEQCHQASARTFASWKGGAMGTGQHAAMSIDAAGACSDCHRHNGTARDETQFRNHISTSVTQNGSPVVIPCEQCHQDTAPVGQSWKNGTLTAAMHTTLGFVTGDISTSQCGSCHDGVQARGKNPTPKFPNGFSKGKGFRHLPTDKDCSLCHLDAFKLNANFLGASWDHSGISANCGSCHNGRKAADQHQNSNVRHIAIRKTDCVACHSPVTGAQDTTKSANWRPGRMGQAEHAALKIVKNCKSCHDGALASGIDGMDPNGLSGRPTPFANHVAIGAQSCESCHQSQTTKAFADWKGAGMNHKGIAKNNCQSCHNDTNAKGFVGNGFPQHLQISPDTPEDCSACHRSSIVKSGIYTSWRGGQWDHKTQNSNDCVSCHGTAPIAGAKDSGAQGQAAWSPKLHVPTGDVQCSTCHAASMRQFGSWAGGVMGINEHVKIDAVANCFACHDGRHDTSKNAKVVGKPGAGRHIPTSDLSVNPNAEPCELCHTSTATFKAPFTFKSAKMVHTAETLNVDGQPLTCGQCHATTPKLAKSMADAPTPPGHLPFEGYMAASAGKCSSCHNTIKFKPAAMDHLGLGIGNQGLGKNLCISCHSGKFSGVGSGQGALGKADAQRVSATHRPHIPTTDDCDACHDPLQTESWTAPHHINTDKNCASCHNGTISTGKPADHVVTAAPCESCHQPSFKNLKNDPNYVPFQNWKGASFEHASLPANASCGNAGCHDGKSGQTGKPKVHIPNPASALRTDCANCHRAAIASAANNYTNWVNTGIVDHAALKITASCELCHNLSYVQANLGYGNDANTSQAKPANHIPNPTNAGCPACHQASATGTTAFATWVPGTFHKSVVAPKGGCSNCHNGDAYAGTPAQQPLGLPPAHVPTGGAACDSCHGSTTSFNASVTMAHSSTVLGVAGGCVTCHGGGTTFAGSTPLNQKPVHLGSTTNHIPVGNANCDVCHGRTSFASFKINKTSAAATMNHAGAGIVNNCASCHDGASHAGQIVIGLGNALPKHIPTTAACELCHNAAKFTSFSGTAMNHAAAGITSGCTTCHGDPQQTFAGNQKPLTKAAPGKLGFTHLATAEACETCHQKSISGGYVSWAGGGWSHLDDKGQKLTTGCDTCHNGTSATGKTGPNKNFVHIPTQLSCEKCHGASITRNFDNFSSGHVDHDALKTALNAPVLDCVSCHVKTPNGVVLPGGLSSFTNYQLSSSAFVMPPISPWNTVAHIPNPGNLSCEKCHGNFVSFQHAVMDHAGINPNATSPKPNCTQCHDNGVHLGMQIKGKAFKPNHVVTALPCEDCHKSTVSFTTDVGFAHSANVGIMNGTVRCDSCHNNTPTATATGTMAGHIPLTVNNVNRDCKDCHQASMTVNNQWPDHAQTFAGGNVDHVAMSINGRCESCHNGAYVSSNAKGKDSAVNHVPVRIGAAAADISCEKCHSHTTAADFASFQVISADFHVQAGITGTGCASCHTGGVFAGQIVVGKSSTHLPITLGATTLGCEQCHRTDNLANWTTARFTPIKMADKHHGNRAIRTNCASCHNGVKYAVSQQAKGTASVTVDHPGQSHIGLTAATGTACESCHGASFSTPAPNGNDYTNWTGGRYDHTKPTPVTSGCSTCHAGTMLGASGMSATHVPTTQSCELCHTYSINDASNKYKLWSYNTAAPNTAMNHTGITTGCSSCHDGQSFAAQSTTGTTTTISPTKKPAGHLPTSEPCESCHKASMLTTTGIWTTWKNGTFDHTKPTAITAGCVSCHDGSVPGASGPPTGTIPATGSIAAAPQHNMTMLTTSQRACENCHAASLTGTAAYTKWTGAVTNHTGFSGNCAACHTGGDWTRISTTSTPPVTVTRTPKGVTSVPTGKTHMSLSVKTRSTCESCHTASMLTTTGTWVSWAGGLYDHKDWTTPASPVAITTGCVSCHADNSPILGATGKSTTAPRHLPTTAGCEVCHGASVTGTSKYQLWSGAKMMHASIGLTAGCNACHGNKTGENGPFQGTPNAGSKPQIKPANHLPTPDTAAQSSDCVVCHQASRTSAATASSDYGSWAGGVYHSVTVTWTSTPRCDVCHSGAVLGKSGSLLTAMAGNHIPTKLLATDAANDDCVTCHAAPTGAGTPPLSAWRLSTLSLGTGAISYGTGYRMVHVSNANAAITANCAACHGDAAGTFQGYPATNSVPVGKAGPLKKAAYSGHPATTSDCSGCHANTWTTAAATGVYTSWTGGKNTGHFDTAGNPMTTGCAACHGGTPANGVPTSQAQPRDANHVPLMSTQLECGLCHQKVWAGTDKTKMFISWIDTGVMNHSGIGITDTSDCTMCHRDASANTPATFSGGKAKPQTKSSVPTLHTGFVHMGTTAACTTCHVGAYKTNPLSWKGQGIYHATAAGHAVTLTGCSGCHGDGTTILGYDPATKPWGAGVSQKSTYRDAASQPLHIPTTAPVQQACETCHNASRTSGYLLWSSGVMSHTGITANNPGCKACHDGRMAMGYPPTKKNGTPAHPDHTFATETAIKATLSFVTGMTCDTCHRVPAGLVTNNAAGVALWGSLNSCTSWHNGAASNIDNANTPSAGQSTCFYCHYGTWAGSANTWGARDPGSRAEHTNGFNNKRSCVGSGCHGSTTLTSCIWP